MSQHRPRSSTRAEDDEEELSSDEEDFQPTKRAKRCTTAGVVRSKDDTEEQHGAKVEEALAAARHPLPLMLCLNAMHC